MGRPEAPLSGCYGPLLEFADQLRRLRQENGGRSYRQLSRSAKFGAATLARAANGRSLPSWEVTRAYVVACGGDPDQWRATWEATARLLRRDREADGQAWPPATMVASPVRQLPADLHDFVGRQCEHTILLRLAEAAAVADPDSRSPVVVLISGPGGVGKSAFGVHAAHLLARYFPDGLLYADLQGHAEQPLNPAQVATQFLAALGHPADRLVDPIAAFRSVTPTRRLLIVLDNAAREEQVSPLLPGSAGCLVIVTSRQAFGTLACAQTLRLDVLDRETAVELLSRVSHPDRTNQADAIATLAELCGCLPLALRIAGARLASRSDVSVGWLVERLRDENHRLRYLCTGDLDLSAVFAVSYRSLGDGARRVFKSAGVFPGPDFSAAALAVLSGMMTIDVECALERLVDASLIRPVQPGRYRIHELLRIYALQCATQENETTWRACALRRLARWYLETVAAADLELLPARGRPAPMPGTPQDPPAMLFDPDSASAWYDTEHANLLAITRAAAGLGDHDVAWRLPVAMRGLLELRGYTDDWITVHRIGRESARAIGDREAEGWVLNGLATGYWRREDYAEAIDSYQEALTIRGELGDERGVAVVLNNLGNVYGARGQYAEAIACLREALAVREKLGDRLDKSFALNNLGHIYHELGMFHDALPLLHEALQIRHELGNRNGAGATLHCLGETLTGLGRFHDALDSLTEALQIFTQLGNRYGEAVTVYSIGSAYRALGRFDQAECHLRRAISLYRNLGRHAEEAAAAQELTSGNLAKNGATCSEDASGQGAS